eukprot:471391_1
MWSSFALITLRAAAVRASVPMVVPTAIKAASARRVACASRRPASSGGGNPFAVDAPDGDHDLQDEEESSAWAKRAIDVASVTEDADAITEMHDAVLGETLFAVDAPDGEHDLEEMEEHLAMVNSIIDQASVLENPNEVRREQHRQEEIRKKSFDAGEGFYNSKY